MKSRRHLKETRLPLRELLEQYLELKELRAKVAEAETSALLRVATPPNEAGDELL
jgi:hypothetical protein